jgi:hypothetical protein
MNKLYATRQKLSSSFFYKTLRLCVSAVIIFLCFFAAEAQSTNQNFPTPVSTNEINGQIAARDIGDSRLTTYFYIFDGNQGDVFINVVTKNLDGDIDVFTVNGLRPLTKIRVYSDNSDNETGRIVYLRQAEKLILRVEGRTPNDDPATFRIKFAGSFSPLKATAETNDTNLPEVKTENQGEVRVNSVGTIIEVKPKATPQPIETKEEKAETVAEEKTEKKKSKLKKDEIAEEKERKKSNGKSEKTNDTEEKSSKAVVVTDNLPKTDETVKKEENKTEDKNASKNAADAKKKAAKTEKAEKAEKTAVPNPLDNIKMIVLFKDGTKIERPMSEVVRVNVDKGVLTIILKDGAISRYSILDVAEMTIK